MLSPQLGASSLPHRARKVPEIDRRSVRDEEGLAIHLFVVERNGTASARGQESDCGKGVCLGNVTHVGHVKEVVVVAELPASSVRGKLGKDIRDELDVSFTKNSGRAKSARQKGRSWFPVGCKDEFLSFSLSQIVSRDPRWGLKVVVPWSGSSIRTEPFR